MEMEKQAYTCRSCSHEITKRVPTGQPSVETKEKKAKHDGDGIEENTEFISKADYDEQK
jgi:hypothetical protein